MGKKKPFIDKKTASVFHVVRRSQRDVGTEATAETLSDFVLMPSPQNDVKAKAREDAQADDTIRRSAATQKNNSKVVDFNTLKSQIAAAGLLDTTSSTYTKYTKPIDSSNGLFVPSNNLHEEDADNLNELFVDTSKNTLDTALEEAMAVHEVGRMLDSIALTADCMEDDMAKALFEYEDDEFEEILDDFCFTANQEELEEGEEDGEGGKNGGGGFNYEQHIALLMEKARAKDNGESECNRELDDYFTGVTPVHAQIDEEDDEDNFDYDQYGEEEEEDEDSLDREFNGKDDSIAKPPTTAASNDEQQRILCQKFEAALLEYDSDDMGDLDEECEDIGGDRPLEGDDQFDAVLNDFLTENQDDILIEGNNKKNWKFSENKRRGGSGYSALVGKTMVVQTMANTNNEDPSKSLLINIEQSKKEMAQDLADADAILANPEVDLPPEEVFIDGKSYFSVTSRNPWDCESILSTYSNLDNNPVVIGRKKKKKGKNKGSGEDVIPEDGPFKIQLSNKTGLPIIDYNSHNPEDDDNADDDDEYYDESDTYLSINRGESRNKDETKMEKKQRKLAIKEERKICRMQKKIMKEAFKEEFQKRGNDVVADAVGGNTVFRFS